MESKWEWSVVGGDHVLRIDGDERARIPFDPKGYSHPQHGDDLKADIEEALGLKAAGD